MPKHVNEANMAKTSTGPPAASKTLCLQRQQELLRLCQILAILKLKNTNNLCKKFMFAYQMSEFLVQSIRLGLLLGYIAYKVPLFLC